MELIILIPAYNPNKRLLILVDDLLKVGFNEIVIVDDGSDNDYQFIFSQLNLIQQVTLLRHAVNLGKGAALKFGFNHIYNLKKKQSNFIGIITADADGQHLSIDISRIANTLIDYQHSLVLGVRSFSSDVPLRSRIGNQCTEFLFRILVGVHITDTQTGLRGIPLELIPLFLRITSNRYEFELDILLKCAEENISMVQIPIQTIYIDDNISSHFNLIIDSAKIYLIFLRFIAASLITAIMDNCIFIITFGLGGTVALSQILARSASILVNFSINRKFVFKHKVNFWFSFFQFIILVIVMGIVSYSAIQFIVAYLELAVITAKILVESILYLFNFAAQRTLIFRKSDMH